MCTNKVRIGGEGRGTMHACDGVEGSGGKCYADPRSAGARYRMHGTPRCCMSRREMPTMGEFPALTSGSPACCSPCMQPSMIDTMRA